MTMRAIQTGSVGLGSSASRLSLHRIFQILFDDIDLDHRSLVYSTERFQPSCSSTRPQSSLGSRWYSKIFDIEMKTAQRSRSARYGLDTVEDPLQDEVASRVVERVEDCSRRFKHALILGGSSIQLARSFIGSHAGSELERIVFADHSSEMLERCKKAWKEVGGAASSVMTEFHVMDPASEQEHIGVAKESFDVVISCLGLHWVNDIPGVMIQCRQALVPDGFFIGALLGGDTLQELRIACTLAQDEREGGVSPRTSPFVHVRDAGNLLTRAGFQIPSVDVDDIMIHYPDPVALVEHLRRMGETNASIHRRFFLSRDTALASAAAYIGMFGENDAIPASYQVIYMTGWSPDRSQPKPATRGSATVSFKDLEDTLSS
jgi:NADH dehydrogenase [ubiquinone] 1 alpha subcomplex assembly factor 5